MNKFWNNVRNLSERHRKLPKILRDMSGVPTQPFYPPKRCNADDKRMADDPPFGMSDGEAREADRIRSENKQREHEPKQIIIMRTDLNMRKGKMCAQAAHASMKVILDYQANPWAALDAWQSGAFVKICVRVDSLEELLLVVTKSKEAGIHYSLIQDAGRTEFGGVPTYTCAAIGPEFPKDIDAITGHLKLL